MYKTIKENDELVIVMVKTWLELEGRRESDQGKKWKKVCCG